MKKVPEQYKNVPRWEYRLGQFVGWVLKHLAIRALRRGDFHEFNHIYASVKLGNSFHDGKTSKRCVVPTDRPLFKTDSVTLEMDLT